MFLHIYCIVQYVLDPDLNLSIRIRHLLYKTGSASLSLMIIYRKILIVINLY